MDNKPVSKRRRKPTDGLGERMILFNSAAILSWEIIPILSLYFFNACLVSPSKTNPSWAANLMARIILRGSSEKVIPGSRGVLIIWLFKSSKPSKESRNKPNSSGFKEKARAFIVKSLLF